MTKKTYVISFLLVFAACAGATLQAQAAPIPYTYCVDNTTDTLPPVASHCPTDGTCSGNCSLRDAIEAANAAPSIADTINIQAGNYVLSGSAGEDLNATGDLDITESVLIVGAGASTTFVDGGGIDRVFEIDPAGAVGTVEVDISGLTIRNGNPGVDHGGGVRTFGSLTLTDCAVSGNTAGLNGGGIVVTSPGSVELQSSAVSGNEATNGNGGGLGVTGAGGVIKLFNSTVGGNRTGLGGGGFFTNANVVMVNSTITGNTADNDGSNGADDLGGGIRMTGGNMYIVNSIIAGNTEGGVVVNPDCSNDGGGLYDSSSGYNLVGKQDGCVFHFNHAGDQEGTMASPVNALLGSLGLHGGLTSTHLLLAGSPAIDTGTATAAPTTDQRGFARPADGDGDGTALHDKGAVEVSCGNGVTEASEECDDGNTDDTDACKNDCTLPAGGTTGGTTTGGTTTGGTTTGGTATGGTTTGAATAGSGGGGGCSLIR